MKRILSLACILAAVGVMSLGCEKKETTTTETTTTVQATPNASDVTTSTTTTSTVEATPTATP